MSPSSWVVSVKRHFVETSVWVVKKTLRNMMKAIEKMILTPLHKTTSSGQRLWDVGSRDVVSTIFKPTAKTPRIGKVATSFQSPLALQTAIRESTALAIATVASSVVNNMSW